MQPHIGEISTDIFVYEIGEVITHIKAPARVNVELPDLEKQIVFPRHGSKYHYNKVKINLTKSAIPHHRAFFI